MTQSDPQTPQDAELPPDAKIIINKARRSFGVSIAILLLGFIAVVGALVYRAYRDADAPDTRYSVQAVNLPSGADLISASTAEGLVTLTYRVGGKTEVRVVDGKSGDIIGQFAVTAE